MSPHLPRDCADVPTRCQQAALENPPGECGYAELEMEMLDAPWVAVRSAVMACKRRGWLDDQGNITELGRAALARCGGAQ